MSIAVDTNDLVHFLTQDDIEQAEIAQDVINNCSAKQPAFIC
jgi:predicted nucleic-acid-binding protein